MVTVFWVTGILKFMNSESHIREEILDSVKDLIMAISIIPLWYLISGSIENDLFEPTSVLIHFIILMVILYTTQKGVILSGPIAYYTHAIIPIIAIIFIRLGVPIIPSVIISVIIPEPINYFYYKKKRVNIVQGKQ